MTKLIPTEVLDDGGWFHIGSPASLESISPVAKELLAIEENAGVLRARRKAPWIVGRVLACGKLIEVPSPISPGLLVPLILYADGVDLKTLRSLPPSALDGKGDAFASVLAKNLLYEVKRQIGGDAARQYVEHRQRALQIRGRPHWGSMLGAHPSSGVLCRTFDLSTDTPMNRLLGFAIIRATALVKSDPEFYRLGLQLTEAWTGLVDTRLVDIYQFDSVLKNLGRQNERYRGSLQLARSILLRIQSDPFHDGGDRAPSIVINLAELLERIVWRLLKGALAHLSNIRVAPQDIDETSFVDGTKKPYRSVRPDLVFYRDGVPIAIFDSKFKPRYIPPGVVKSENLVTSSDLFQIAFYQSRLQLKFNLANPPIAVLVAPQLHQLEIPLLERRTITWGGADAGIGTKVISLPLHRIVAAIRSGQPESLLIAAAPELASVALDMVGVANLPAVQALWSKADAQLAADFIDDAAPACGVVAWPDSRRASR